MRIDLLPSRSLDQPTRAGVARVFASSFDSAEPGEVIDRYADAVDEIFVAREGAEVVGFQFFQRRRVADRTVLHFSLAGRLAEARFRGLQARFGHLLIRRAVLRVPPWRPVFLAGVTNSPRSYRNMRVAGGRCFPDVLAPQHPNPFGSWYADTAERLGVPTVSARGLVRDRMRDLGYALRPEPRSPAHPLARAYDEYVEGNRDDGLFVVVELLPVRDLPPYLLSSRLNIPRQRGPEERAAASPAADVTAAGNGTAASGAATGGRDAG